jgi:DNA-binding beta-propeller fold protein YncE
MIRPNANGLSGTVYEWKSQTGSAGTGNGQFNFPQDVAVDSNHLYVADKMNHRIQKFAIDYNANTLTWEATWGRNGGDGTSGSGQGEFWRPTGIAINPADHHVFVADSYNHRIQEFEADGDFVAQWGVGVPSTDPLYLSGVNGIDVDADGSVYATDFTDATSWVNKYARDAGGAWERVTRLGGWGIADAQFEFPWSCAVDPNGYLYVTDTQNQKLKTFARDATAPTVTPAGWPAGWTNSVGHPEFTAADPAVTGQYTSGGVSIWYSKTGGAPWTHYYEPFALWDFVQGDNTFTYYAKDAVGNESTPADVHLYYDSVRPVPKARADKSVKRLTTVRLPYRVNDASSPKAKVVIRIFKGSTRKLTLGVGTKRTNTALTYSFRCKLAKGKYSWKVYATDLAGNMQAKPGVRTLTVK